MADVKKLLPEFERIRAETPSPFTPETHNRQVRELLCKNCNTGIGFFAEETRVLQAAVEYLNFPGMAPQDIQLIPSERPLARVEIPYWEAQSRDEAFRKQKIKTWNSITTSVSTDIKGYWKRGMWSAGYASARKRAKGKIKPGILNPCMLTTVVRVA